MFLPIEDPVERFEGFGPSRMAFGREPPVSEATLAADDGASRRLLRENCPDAPGVYGMIDADGKLIYVGKSKSLRERLLSYLTGSSLDRKARRIITCARRVVWESAPHEFTALLRELELIRRFRPRFNVRGRPDHGKRAYLALGRGPAPYAYLAEKGSGRDRLLVGPLWPGRQLRRMVRTVNDCFGLRDCPGRVAVAFSDQRELFPRQPAAGCIRYEVGTCPGPCIASCSARRYAANVRQACGFLAGADLTVLPRLEQAMRDAAVQERFECAAALRDQWRDLTELHAMLERVRTVERTYAFIYPVPSYRSGQTWHLIRRGQVVQAIPGPRSLGPSRRVMHALDQVYPAGAARIDRTMPDDPDLILLVSLWFRSHPEELGQTLSPEAARRIVLPGKRLHRLVVKL